MEKAKRGSICGQVLSPKLKRKARHSGATFNPSTWKDEAEGSLVYILSSLPAKSYIMRPFLKDIENKQTLKIRGRSKPCGVNVASHTFKRFLCLVHDQISPGKIKSTFRACE